jgi:hypothetical protein
MHSEIPFVVNEECTIQTAAFAAGGPGRPSHKTETECACTVCHIRNRSGTVTPMPLDAMRQRHKTTADANEMCSWH